MQHVQCVVDNRFMLVHGGYNGLRPITCFWVLDLATGSWIEHGLAEGEQRTVDSITSALYGTRGLKIGF
jgi:hypothetical protein